MAALIWTVVDAANLVPWLQGADIDLADRRRSWLRLVRPLWAGSQVSSQGMSAPEEASTAGLQVWAVAVAFRADAS